MIQYLKNSEKVIKLDDETQSTTVCVNTGGQMLIKHDTGNSTLYDAILTQGPYITITEEEYLTKKAEILLAF
jgi:hypothetical protein